MSTKPARFTLLVKLVITIALLALVCWKAGLFEPSKRTELWRLLQGIRIPYLLLSLFLGVLLNLVSSIKWHMLLNSRSIRVPLIRLYGLYMVGKFFNLILPTSVGGDVIRMHELGRHTDRRADAVASVFVERFTGIVTLMIITAGAVLINLQTFNIPVITYSLLAAIAVITVAGWLIIDSRPLEYMQKTILGRISIIKNLMEKAEQFQKAVNDYRQDASALWVAGANSIVFYFLAVLNVWVSALAFNGQVDLITMIVIVPVIMLIMNLPISIGGIGLMEFAYTFTFEVAGLNSALGLSTALLMRFKTIIDALVGALIFPILKQNHSPRLRTKHHKR